jgi:hypothetical protein
MSLESCINESDRPHAECRLQREDYFECLHQNKKVLLPPLPCFAIAV